MPAEWSQKRDDHRYISEAEGVKKIVQGSAAYRKAGNKFGEHDEPNGGVNEFKRRTPLNERGYD
jgi:hypothetical protein